MVCFDLNQLHILHQRVSGNPTYCESFCTLCVCDPAEARGPCMLPDGMLIASLQTPLTRPLPLACHLSAVHWCSDPTSSRPAPPQPLNIHTLAMRYFCALPTTPCSGNSRFLLSPHLSQSLSTQQGKAQLHFYSPYFRYNQFELICIWGSISLHLSVWL